MEILSNLKKCDSFIIPGDTDALPIESPGEGSPYLYHVTGTLPDGRIKAYNTDLRKYTALQPSILVEKL